MQAMVLEHIVDLNQEDAPLSLKEIPAPSPGHGEVLIKVSACGVCHTELDEIEGRTPPPHLPVIPGHQVVGRVAACGSGVRKLGVGDQVGVAWIYWACGECRHCRSDMENLCSRFKATGRDANGGYAQYMKVDEHFAHPIPAELDPIETAPLLCAGAIGYRSLRLAGLRNGRALGLTGFGASAHLVLKLVRYQYPDSEVYVFARSPRERTFAEELGAIWAGDATDTPPCRLNAVIDTTPAWKPVVEALRHLEPGGRLVINAIRKETADLAQMMKLDYEKHLWLEKEIKSVANVTRRDVREFLSLAAKVPIKPAVQTYAMQEANQALMELKQRKIRGAKVLVVEN